MRRIAAVFWIGLFIFAGAQLPEFVVQYAQRLGGATDEVVAFLKTFDEGASRAGHTRHTAIETLLKNPEHLVRQQGLVARTQVERFERLSKQRAALSGGLTLGSIYFFLTDYDAPLAQNTLSQFVPGLSASPIGILFAILGGLIGAGLLLVIGGLSLLRGRAVEA